MPMHPYKCDCGHAFELFEGILDTTDKQCAACGGLARICIGQTAKPILRAGSGGFYNPSKE